MKAKVRILIVVLASLLVSAVSAAAQVVNLGTAATSIASISSSARRPRGRTRRARCTSCAAGIYCVQIRAASPAGWGPPSNVMTVMVGRERRPADRAGKSRGDRRRQRRDAAVECDRSGVGVHRRVSRAGRSRAGERLDRADGDDLPRERRRCGPYYVRVRAATAAGVSAASSEIVVVVR